MFIICLIIYIKSNLVYFTGYKSTRTRWVFVKVYQVELSYTVHHDARHFFYPIHLSFSTHVHSHDKIYRTGVLERKIHDKLVYYYLTLSHIMPIDPLLIRLVFTSTFPGLLPTVYFLVVPLSPWTSLAHCHSHHVLFLSLPVPVRVLTVQSVPFCKLE